MSVKRDKYDAIFSNLIRERADYICEHCETKIPEGMRQAAHCAHIHGRSSRATRWDADNAICLCASCHFYFTDHPIEFTAWVFEHLGPGLVEILSEKAHSVRKWTKTEKDEMYRHYRAEYKRMKVEREKGKTGRIEFDGY